MLRFAFEKGIASLLARWLLEGQGEALFQSIERAGALPPEEIVELRAERERYLRRVRDEGAPYADIVKAAFKEMAPSIPDLSRGAPAAAMGMATLAIKAVEATLERASAAVETVDESDEDAA